MLNYRRLGRLDCKNYPGNMGIVAKFTPFWVSGDVVGESISQGFQDFRINQDLTTNTHEFARKVAITR